MVRLVVLLMALTAWRASAQVLAIPVAETAQPPTPARLTAIRAAARRDGWGPQIAPLRQAALAAYGTGRLPVADAWFHVYGWASLFGRMEADFVPHWIEAVNAAKVGHANMPREFTARYAPLGAAVSPELQAWLINDASFSGEFFGLVAPVDYLPRVFEILDALYRSSPTDFKEYSALALAIAVVFDVPPPPTWPHGQVRPEALARKFPAPVDAFHWWIRQDQSGRLTMSLKRRRADELKYIVDAAAPFPELEWAQPVSASVPADLVSDYLLVKYRLDRVANNQPIWPGRTYRLSEIMNTGGICADQAYFACEVGKARGIPTLFFHGAGNDGRHAWFGYLDAQQQWRFDAGRYAEQRYVTGYTYDPQTWRELSDHELQFLQEHFHTLLSYRQSRIHATFAADMLAAGDAAAAEAAARLAVRFEPRNQDAWEVLTGAMKRQGASDKTIEVAWREAALAFQRYPDLEAYYVGRVVDSLRARGQSSEADEEVRRIARKNQGDRVDLSVKEARDIVLHSISHQPFNDQIRTYNLAVSNYGRSAGIAFFDQVVVVFVEHLQQLQRLADAERAIAVARQTMAPSAGSQLEGEFDRLEKRVRLAPRNR